MNNSARDRGLRWLPGPGAFRKMFTVSTTTLTAWLATSPAVAAQAIRTIRDEPSCPACRIDLVRKLELAAPGGSVPIDVPSAVTVDEQGRIFVAFRSSPAEIWAFDNAGALLRSYGRRGEGPGEFIAIGRLAASRNGVYAFDAGLRRMTALDTAFQIKALGQLPGGALGVLLLDDGNIVLNSVVPTVERIGLPLHVIDGTGKTLMSFGGRGGRFSPSEAMEGVWRLALSSNGREFIAGWAVEYRLERWTTDGTLKEVFIRDAPWFPRVVQTSDPPPAALHGLQFDDSGRLWVMLKTRDRRWQEYMDDVRRDPTRPSAGDRSGLWDTVLEVLDLQSGVVLARTRLDGDLLGFVGGDMIYSYEESGVPTVVFWSPRVVEPEPRRKE